MRHCRIQVMLDMVIHVMGKQYKPQHRPGNRRTGCLQSRFIPGWRTMLANGSNT